MAAGTGYSGPKPPGDIRSYTSACRDSKAEVAGLSRRFVKIEGRLGIWVYLGEHGDYIVLRGLYCSCPKFLLSARRGSGYCCHHIAGLELALERGRYRVVRGLDEVEVVSEVLAYGYSYSVRRLVFASADDVGYDDYERED